MLRIIRLAAFLLIGLALGLGLKAYMQQSEMNENIDSEEEISSLTPPSSGEDEGEDSIATVLTPPQQQAVTTSVPGVAIGGPFTLLDQDGKTVTEKDFHGSYTLIFFGFTYCPAVCPTELQKMLQAMELAGPDKAAKIKPVFISVDPERDDVATVKEYVARFDKRLIGLTGTPEQVETAKKAFRVYASKAQMEGMEDYMMDHSAFMYLMGPDGANIAIYPAKDTAEQIAEDLKGKVE